MIGNLIFAAFLTTISPVVTLWHALRLNGFALKRWVLTITIAAYGSVIFLSEMADGYDHRQNVYDHYVGLPIEQFIAEFFNIMTFRSNDDPSVQSDVFIHLLSYFVAEVIQLPGLFFVFVSLIYGYFFSGGILKVLRYVPKFRDARLLYGFVVVLILWKNVEGINTVRTWTGLWILFYASISYFETHKRKYLILLLIPPFVHLGYFVMILPVFAVIAFGPRPLLYSVLFAASFTTTLFSQKRIVSQLQQTEVGKEKVRNYFVEDRSKHKSVWTAEKLREKTWYTRLQRSGLSTWTIACLAFALILLGFYSSDRMSYIEVNLFSIGLLMKVLSNSTWFLFALSNRSDVVAGLFLLASFVMILARLAPSSWQERMLAKFVAPAALLLLTPFMIYKIADLLQYTSVYVFFFPFVAWIDPSLNISIRGALEYLR